jgi:uncharacterized phage protein (TIGR02218 family)
MPMSDPGDLLDAELTCLAMCWRVVRQDGVALGFTTHDRPLTIAGLCYESAPGMAPSAIVSSDGLDVDTMEIAGALTADAITSADLVAGRFDGAAIEVFMVDWRVPDAGQHLLTRASLGKIEAGRGNDSGFVATARGLTAALGVTSVESYAPQCRAELGDRRCRVTMRGLSLRAIAASDAAGAVVVTAADFDPANFAEGRLRVLEGPLAGIERRIIAVIGTLLCPDEPIDLLPGTPVQLWQGCDKQFVTCATRFANSANFRGEPHVPGADTLTRIGS